MKFRPWTITILGTLCAGMAFAQSKTAGTLSGTVTDPTDSVVPGAKITVTSAETGTALESTLTDVSGEYRIPLLPPGVYDIKVERPGFAVQSRKSVVITVGQAAVIDVRLSVGVSSQVIEVQALPPLIETERTQQSNTIDELSVRNAPDANVRVSTGDRILAVGRDN